MKFQEVTGNHDKKYSKNDHDEEAQDENTAKQKAYTYTSYEKTSY